MTRDLPAFAAAIARDGAPASGSAAAYALAMAAALCEKVARRSPNASVDSRFFGSLRTRALLLMDDDERAVKKMLAAGRPTAGAIAVPGYIGRLAEEIGEAAGGLEQECSPHLIADVQGAVALVRAAAQMVAAIGRSNSEGGPENSAHVEIR